MKKICAALLIVLFSAVCSPLSIAVLPYDESVIITLDVCSKSGPAASVNADSPAISESSYCCSPLSFSEYFEESFYLYHPSAAVFAQERPPKV